MCGSWIGKAGATLRRGSNATGREGNRVAMEDDAAANAGRAAPEPSDRDRTFAPGEPEPTPKPARTTRPRDAESRLPAGHLPAWRRTVRYYVSRLVAGALVKAYLRVRLEDRDRLPRGS